MAGKTRSLGSLLVNVGADTRALETGLKSATQDVSTFGNRTQATARRAEGALTKMGRGGFQISQGFSGLGKFLPGLGGMFGAGALASMAFSSVQQGFQEAAAVSPSVATIQARREQFRFKKALERGENDPVTSELMAGGFESSVSGGFSNVFDEAGKNQREGDFLGYLFSNLPIGIISNFISGFIDEQTAAQGDNSFLPIDQARLERNRLELFGPAPVAGTGNGSAGSSGGK